MLFSSLKMTLHDLFLKPKTLIPMLIVSIISSVIIMLLGWIISRPMMDIFLYYESFANTNIFALALFNYPLEIVIAIISGLFLSTITIIGLLSVTRMSQGDGLMEAVNDSISEWRKTFALVVLVILLAIIFLAGLFLVGWVSGINEIAGMLALIIYGIILIITMVKLVFFIPALLKEEPKEALKLSWEFTNDNFWASLLLIVILLLVFFIVNTIFGVLSDATGLAFEDVFFVISNTISMTFFGLAVSHYYYSK